MSTMPVESLALAANRAAADFLETGSAHDLDVAVRDVARIWGGARYQPTPEIQAMIQSILDRARTLVHPRAAACEHRVRERLDDGRLILENHRVLDLGDTSGGAIGSLVVLAASIGPELEIQTRALASQGRYAESTAMDAAGTALLLAWSKVLTSGIAKTAGDRGGFIGRIVRPGVGGVPLERQVDLFGLVDAEAIQVRLNSSFLMEPIKTVSRFLLVTDRPGRRVDLCSCHRCPRTDCTLREAAGDPEGDDSIGCPS